MTDTVKLPASYYEQFDADHNLDVPAEGYGGWRRGQIEISLAHTALVVMHAWSCGPREEYPGWWRAIEYIPRSLEICRTVFPPLLEAVRGAGMTVLHVVGGADYYKGRPGYARAVALAGPPPEVPEIIESDPALGRLHEFRDCFGKHNAQDMDRGFKSIGFPPEVAPRDDEGVAENAHQLFALCKDGGINHLIYVGFAINWCLLLSPGGMADMHKHGLMCSTIREATTAVENKQTARDELCKQIALWRVAIAFGFVFDVDEFIAAVKP